MNPFSTIKKLSIWIFIVPFVAVSMGLRQTFGLFSDFFVRDLQATVTEFGLAIGIQMLMWGVFAPIFGAMADKIGGNKVTIIAFVFFALGIYFLYREEFARYMKSI